MKIDSELFSSHQLENKNALKLVDLSAFLMDNLHIYFLQSIFVFVKKF